VVALLLTPVLAGPRRRGIALALILAAVTTGGVYLLAVAPPENLERLTAADATGSGRTDIWKVGLRMVSANPVVGVGAGNYPNSTIHYLFEPGTITRSDFIVDLPKPAHNVYLQALAELGAVGLTLFLLVLGASLRAVLLAARTFRRAGDRSMELLSRALLIGLCGLLASAFFSTAIYSKQLWLMLALAVAVHALARERAAPPAA
jgi:O-antigen ligase